MTTAVELKPELFMLSIISILDHRTNRGNTVRLLLKKLNVRNVPRKSKRVRRDLEFFSMCLEYGYDYEVCRKLLKLSSN